MPDVRRPNRSRPLRTSTQNPIAKREAEKTVEWSRWHQLSQWAWIRFGHHRGPTASINGTFAGNGEGI